MKFRYIKLHYRQAKQIGLGIGNFRVYLGLACCLLYLERKMSKKKSAGQFEKKVED